MDGWRRRKKTIIYKNILALFRNSIQLPHHHFHNKMTGYISNCCGWCWMRYCVGWLCLRHSPSSPITCCFCWLPVRSWMGQRKCGKCKGRAIIKTIDTFENNFRFSLFFASSVIVATYQFRDGLRWCWDQKVRRVLRDFCKFGLSVSRVRGYHRRRKSTIKLNMQMEVQNQF